jgi:hypothetical protein
MSFEDVSDRNSSGVSGRLADVADTVAKALTVDYRAQTPQELVADAALLTELRAQLDALDARVVAAADQAGVWAAGEHANCAAMLRSQHPNRHRGDSYRRVRHGRHLAGMPHAAAAMEAGHITTDHVRVLATCLHARFEGRFAEFEQQLVSYAVEFSYPHFCRLVQMWKDAADASEPDLRDRKDQQAREVHLSRTFGDRGTLSGTLTPTARVVVETELARLCDQLFEQDWAEAVERLGEGTITKDDLQRTPAQRRHDALVMMALRSASAGPSTPDVGVTIYVHCTPEELEAALADEPCDPEEAEGFEERIRELDDETPISRGTLARLALGAHIRRVVHGAQGEVLDFGRRRRFFTPTQREAMAVRERWCRCGCGLPARRCHADHVVEWRHGGLTDLANAAPRCPASHLAKTNRNDPRRE